MVRRYNIDRACALAAFAGAALALAHPVRGQANWAAPVSGSWFVPENWSPVGVPNAAGTSITLGLGGAYTVSMQNGSATCGNIWITNPGVTLHLVDNAQLAVAGASVVNAGLIQFSGPGAPGNSTGLVAASPMTMSGSGTLRLDARGNGDNDTAYVHYAAAAHTITNAAAHTIAGKGRFYAGLANDGVVSADASGAYLVMLDQPKSNSGRMTAGGGGVLYFRTIALTQTPAGIVQSGPGSPVQVYGTNVSGGTLDGAGGGIQYLGACAADSATMLNANSVADNALLNIGAGGVVNNGLLTISEPGAPGNQSRIQAAAGSAALSGVGTLRLQGVAGGNGDNDSAYLGYTLAGNELVNGSEHSIRGYGRVYVRLINNGDVNADVPGKGLFFVDQPKTNNGTITASNGGLVQFREVTLTGSPGAQIVSKDAVSPVQVVNSAILGGTCSAGGSGRVEYYGISSLSNAMLSGTQQIADNSLLHLNTDLVNDGNLRVSDPSAPGNGTGLVISAGSVVLSGDGSITLQGIGGGNGDNNSAFIYYAAPADVLTLESGQTLRGYGRIYASIINNGTVNADVAPFGGPGNNIDKGLFFIDQPKANNGTIAASNGGFVQFRSVSVTNSPAARVVSADASSPVQVVNSSFSGGTLEAGATGRFEYSGVDSLSDVVMSGVHEVVDNSAVNLNTNLINNGAWKINRPAAPGNYTCLVVNAPSITVSGTGSIALQGIAGGNGDNTSAFISYAAAGNVLTLGSGQTLSGYGRVYANIVNHGVIEANVAGKGIFLVDQPKTNSGAITARNGGVVQIRSTGLTQSPEGVVTTSNAGQIQLNSATLTGGTVATTASGPLVVLGASTINDAELSGVARITDNSILYTSGLTNEGTLEVASGGNLTRMVAPAAATVNGSGEIRLIATGFNNDTVYLYGMGGANNPLTLGPGQKLSGTGRLYGSVVVQGAIEPDQPFGTPAPVGGIGPFGGTLVLGPSSIFRCQLASAGSYDSMQGNSAVTLSGALDVSFAGYTPGGGDLFDIVIGSAVAGRFSSVTMPAVGSFGPVHVAYLPDRARVVMCYANCDGSDAPPALNVNDFTCFLNRFSAAISLPAAQQVTDYANCDGSTTAPVLNVNDFICYQAKFAAACP